MSLGSHFHLYFCKKIFEMSKFYPLSISKIVKETPNSVVLSFEVPENLQETFAYKAGQYLTIAAEINGKEVRRSYSLCSAPHSKQWSVGIKKVEGGLFSVFANEQLKEGSVLKVMPPQGHFLLTPNQNNQNHYGAFAAGSGITPIMGMLETVLEKEPSSSFTLVFGNQNQLETIFLKRLKTLEAEFQERLNVHYFYSRESVEECFFGRIEKSMVNFLTKNKFDVTTFHSFYLCGPEAMIFETKDTLQEKGVAEDAIHFELFSSTAEGSLTEAHDGQTKITVTVDDVTETFMMPQNKNVLDAVLEKDLDAPYSCQGGICSSCLARVTEGKVEMKKNQILTDSEVAEGLILTCQAHPTTPILVIDYDNV